MIGEDGSDYDIPHKTASFALTSVNVASGTAAPAWRTGRASASMLRTCEVRISPLSGRPSGNKTLEPKRRIVFVIGQTMTKADA